jgi:hypothetical protein
MTHYMNLDRVLPTVNCNLSGLGDVMCADVLMWTVAVVDTEKCMSVEPFIPISSAQTFVPITSIAPILLTVVDSPLIFASILIVKLLTPVNLLALSFSSATPFTYSSE